MAVQDNNSGQLSSSDNQYSFTDILKAINFTDPAEVAKKATGEKIAAKMYNDQIGSADNLNFFAARAAKCINMLKWATGTQDMTEFLDYFNVSEGNKAYVKIDMTPIMVGPQFVNTLVESVAKNEEYPCVTAIDEDSISEKDKQKKDALFRMHDVATIHDLQQKSGVALEPHNAYVPDDEMAADVYFELEHRLPKEIKFEKKLEDVMDYNNYQRVLKRKLIYDEVVHNIGMTKIERYRGKYMIRKCLAQNIFYNYFVGDTGKTELAYLGEFYSLKIRDVREKYGASPTNPTGLTEKQIFELAKFSQARNTGIGFSYIWKEDYNYYNYNRPWDDYGIYTMDFEIQISESDYYVGKTDSWGKMNITPKQAIPNPTSDKATVFKKSKNKWYRGVYAPYAKMMLYWGLPDVVVFPFNDYEQCLSSYSINIPNNNGMYVPSLFERAMEPLKEYAITKLKRKQLIAKLRPSGIRIDVENARNIDLGSGNSIPWEEVVRIFDQTGNEIFSSRGVDPLRQEAPALSATAPDDTLQKIVQLTQTLGGIIMEIRQLLGVPPSRDGSPLPSRTPAELAENQVENSSNVTDFIPNAVNELMEETLYKCCLLYWQDEIKSGSDPTLINTRFRVSVMMKETAYEKQQLEQMIQTGMQEQLLDFKDAFQIRQIKNFKLAQIFLYSTANKNKREAAAAQQKNIQDNAQAQQASAQQAAQQQLALQQQELQMKSQMQDSMLRREKEKIATQQIMQMVDSAITAGTTIPDEWKPVAMAVISNVLIPIQQENSQMKTAADSQIAHQYAMGKLQQVQQAQQPQQGQPPQDPNQPQQSDPTQMQQQPSQNPQQAA
jgi:hypothetical protein